MCAIYSQCSHRTLFHFTRMFAVPHTLAPCFKTPSQFQLLHAALLNVSCKAVDQSKELVGGASQ